MNAIERIKAVGETASDAEYKEQRDADQYNALCDLRQKFGLAEEDITEHSSEINYLMAEVSSLHAKVEELAIIIDEIRAPSNEDRVERITKALWERIDILQKQINECAKA